MKVTCYLTSQGGDPETGDGDVSLSVCLAASVAKLLGIEAKTGKLSVLGSKRRKKQRK